LNLRLMNERSQRLKDTEALMKKLGVYTVPLDQMNNDVLSSYSKNTPRGSERGSHLYSSVKAKVRTGRKSKSRSNSREVTQETIKHPIGGEYYR